MKVLLSWLRRFAPIEGSPEELADHLSDLGLAVESMTVLPSLDGVLVGRVAGLRPHPNADRIQLVDVDLGGVDLDGADSGGADSASADSDRARQVCCGAFNMSVGDLVPVATVGTTMPDGMVISERKMRGELSQGMCCSAAELGLGTDHDGIMILPPDLLVGDSLMGQLELSDDVVYDLEVNPNRPDALSVAGVARDLAARMGVTFSIPIPEINESPAEAAAASPVEASPAEAATASPVDVNDSATVRIYDADLCGRFVVRVARNVQVVPSPLWLQIRLALCGMRPINSVVDVSNFVMLELGTPSHTYDLDKLPEGHIGTRRSPGGEQIVTLDGQERTLVKGDGVIVDAADKPIGIAGVMGGASTEISEQTSAVLLEMAWWNSASIAATSQRLGLRSEASMRFERGSDWDLKSRAADRFCELLAQITPGVQIAEGAIDVAGDLPPQPEVSVRPERISHLLGREFSGEEITALLEPIGFEVNSGDAAPVPQDPVPQDPVPQDPVPLEVTVPSFRPDTATETDIAEEVGRHFGYGKLGMTVPRSSRPGRLTPKQQLRRKLRQVLVGEGVSEAMPNPFLAPDAVSRAGLDEATAGSPIRLLNPLVTEESVLRPSLLPGLLAAVGYNESHRNEGVSLFELGVVFGGATDPALMTGAESAGDEHEERDPNVTHLPVETERLSVILAGQDAHAAAQLWSVIAEALGVQYKLANTTDISYMHPTRAAAITLVNSISESTNSAKSGASTSDSDGGSTPLGVPEIPLGVLGELDPSVCERHGISQRCAWLDVRADALIEVLSQASVASDRAVYRPVSQYPSGDFDLALVVDDSVSAGEMEATLREAAGEQLQSLSLFDVYRGSQLPAGHRSLAYRLRVQADDHTLTDAELTQIRQECIKMVAKRHGASLRDH